MIIVKPETVDDSVLTSTLVEPDFSRGEVEWSSYRKTAYTASSAYNSLSEYDDRVFVGSGSVSTNIYTHTLNSDYTVTSGSIFTLNAATGPKVSVAYGRVSDAFVVLDSAGALTFYTGSGLYVGSTTNAEIIGTGRLCPFGDGFIFAKTVNTNQVKYFLCSGFTPATFSIDGSYTVSPVGDSYDLRDIAANESILIITGYADTAGDSVADITWFTLFSEDAPVGQESSTEYTPVSSAFDNSVYLSFVRYKSDLSARGALYEAGDIATLTSDHSIYQCVTTDNLDRPDAGAAKEVPTWIKYAPTNKYAMFDGSTSNQSISESGTVTTTLVYPSAITSICGFNLDNVSTVGITVSGGTAYSETITMGADKTFSRFGLNGTTVTLVFTPSASPMKIGKISCGEERLLGESNFGGSVGLLDFSRVENDTFGNTTITPRRKVKLIDYDVTIDTSDVEDTFNFISSITTVPAVYAAESEFTGQALVVFAIYQDFRAVIEAPEVSTYTLSVQGLT